MENKIKYAEMICNGMFKATWRRDQAKKKVSAVHHEKCCLFIQYTMIHVNNIFSVSTSFTGNAHKSPIRKLWRRQLSRIRTTRTKTVTETPSNISNLQNNRVQYRGALLTILPETETSPHRQKESSNLARTLWILYYVVFFFHQLDLHANAGINFNFPLFFFLFNRMEIRFLLLSLINQFF